MAIKSLFYKIENAFALFKYLTKKSSEGLQYYKRLSLLKEIIRKKSLSTFFQPILQLQTGHIIGYEVLNRPPLSGLFPSTEQFYDFIGQTDQVFLFELFCRNLSLHRFFHQAKNSYFEKDPLIFINIHPQVLMDSHHRSGETLNFIESAGIPPCHIVFELTEKHAVTDFVEFEKVLKHYRSQGFRIAIDDAGSGYNSLKTLVYLKPEFIKLDKSLIRGIHADRVKQQLVNLLLEFANQSGTFVIAEGIENNDELLYLQTIGIHFGQGYALGRPSPHLLTERNITYSVYTEQLD